MKHRIIAICVLAFVSACDNDTPAKSSAEFSVDEAAREYLLLELGMGQHDPDHVDAYFGPQELEIQAVQAALSLDDIRSRSAGLAEGLGEFAESATPEELTRIDGMLARLRALDTRIDIAQGIFLPFDEEAERLFGARPPEFDDEYFASILAEFDALLPGEGSLAERVDAYRRQFEIPPDKLDAVTVAAIAECRRRTLEHIALPTGETFTLAYVTDKPWGAYNWYQGNARSLIEVNTDLPTRISAAVGRGCHEGYPGHHVYNALIERALVQDRGWLEFSLYPLFSPQSLIAEGTANYGRELVFPGDERILFEKSVLFPLAGLDATEADRYYALNKLSDKLAYVSNEAARDYLNGDKSREETIQWLVDFGVTSPERAAQSVDFYDKYRSYVINYNFGADLVRGYVERGGSDTDSRWSRFEELLTTPVLPADL